MTTVPPFPDLDKLSQYLSKSPGTVDPKRYPIVLVPGFLGWASPLFNSLNYFGGFISLAQVLANNGWQVICPQVGPVSSNWERACELYAQLSHGSLDGKTYDIIVDYGKPIPSKNVFYTSPPPLRKQAVCFNMDPKWRWGPESPVHFIAHSQGGNTCRYLIHLLERGWSEEGSAYFTEEKLGWVKSLTTLSTPHNGTGIIDALGDLGKVDDIALNQLISVSSYLPPTHRQFDFSLDHRGIGPPTSPNVDLVEHLAQLTAPDGALTRWRESTYNGLHDNSILGVVGDLNRIIGSPSKDVYYFTFACAATVPVPKLELQLEDMRFLPQNSKGMLAHMDEWQNKIPYGPTWVMGKLLTGFVEKLPVGVLAGLFSRFYYHRETTITTSPPASSESEPARAPSISITTHAVAVAEVPSTQPRSSPVIVLSLLRGIFGGTLQDVATWVTSRINARLPTDVPQLPPPGGSTVPRIDMLPFLLPVAPYMCAFKLSAAQRAAVGAAGGIVEDKAWQEHDGVVPTCSMYGPWGPGNTVLTVDDIVKTGSEGGRRSLKGTWVTLGKCDYMDHLDCNLGGFTPKTIMDMMGLYSRISRLLEVLPTDPSQGESE